MDTQVKRIRPSDYELSTVQENLATTLQQVLDFLNKAPASAASLQQTLTPLLAQVRGPGTPQSMTAPALLVHGDPTNSGQNVVQIGDPATATASAIGAQVGIIGNLNLAGAFTLTGDSNLSGNFYIKARTANGFVIQSGASGPTFYVTNPAGNQAVFLVYSDGGVVAYGGINAPNFISGAGFKTAIDIGTVWNTSAGAGAYYQTIKAVVNQVNGSLGSTPFIFKFPYAGSIVGWSLNNAGPDLGTLGLRYYRNGALIGNPLTGGGGGNNATFWGTHAKGVFQYAAGDTLTVFAGCSNAGNFQASVQLTLEMGA